MRRCPQPEEPAPLANDSDSDWVFDDETPGQTFGEDNKAAGDDDEFDNQAW